MHNIVKYLQDPEPELPEFGEDFAVTEDDNEDAAARNTRHMGEARRNQLAKIIYEHI